MYNYYWALISAISLLALKAFLRRYYREGRIIFEKISLT